MMTIKMVDKGIYEFTFGSGKSVYTTLALDIFEARDSYLKMISEEVNSEINRMFTTIARETQSL